MKKYKNLSGNSGVLAYKTGADNIQVQFVGGAIYLYTYKSAGISNIEEMKKLAGNGLGLSTFISRNVKDRYELVTP